MKKNVSIGELMGSRAASAGGKKLSLDDLGDLLGERCPKIEFSPVGRLRLTSAMRQRFGDNYKNLPGISDILTEFDKEAKFNVKLQEIKMVKYAKEKKKD